MFRKWVGDFTALFYPENCLACSDSLAGNEKVLCTSCRLGLPLTGFHNVPDNPVEKLFWGRIPVAHATAFLFFEKTTKYRSLIHQLKYNGRKEAGIFLGNLMGSVLRHSRFEEADVMTSVPLHKAKFRRRGYNQSDIIARGITEFTKKPF
ncbi:MAG: ComF family protein, partial [Bacteroidales bacterium]